MAAISGSTGPATVEYHKKPTVTQSDLVTTSLGNANPVLLRVLFYLTSSVQGTKVNKIFTVIFGKKSSDIVTCMQYQEKHQRLLKLKTFLFKT